MREFLSTVIMPLPTLYLLLITGFVFYMFKRKKTSKFLFILVGLWFLILTTPSVPKALVRSLENKYPHLADTAIRSLPDSCDIIILGGGHSDDKELSPNNQLSVTAIGRLAEGIRIHRMKPDSRLILSGWGGKTDLPQALVLYRTALLLGVDSASMAMQTLPSNTRMEAEEYVRIFGREKSLIIVTNDIHMPRAMMLFRKAGLDPVAAPTNQIIKYGTTRPRWRWVPSSDYIVITEEVLHEYAGMIWMKLSFPTCFTLIHFF